MSPKKRLNVNSKVSKRKKKIPEVSEDLQENSENSCELYLTWLPDEIILYIYEYLSLTDLSSLRVLGNQRLTELMYTMKELNFSSCRTANPQLVSAFFTRISTNYIQKLNFNYYFFVRPQALTVLIGQCKNLSVLSVVECGLKYNNILDILKNCSRLEELAWNVSRAPVGYLLNISCPKMKRIHLLCDAREICLGTIQYTIQNFPRIENIWINFSYDAISTVPFIGPWLRSTCVSSSKFSNRFTLITNGFQYFSNSKDLEFLSAVVYRPIRENDCLAEESTTGKKKMLQLPLVMKHRLCAVQQEFREIMDLHFEKCNSVRSRVYSCPPYLQIRSIKEDISSVSSGSFKTFSSMTIILTPEIVDVSEELVKCANEISGEKMKHLSIEREVNFVTDNSLFSVPISEEEAVVLCNVLEEMFLTSKNITVLNLTTVHFIAGSPFKAITQLKHLKILNIPSCAFPDSYKSIVEYQIIDLAEVVSCCPKVENFTLNCCSDHIFDQVPEKKIVSMKGWKYLKHLSVYCLVFPTCSFLRKVADSCVHLQSLSLISVAYGNDCHFTGDVIYLLKKARNLTFLRINETQFNPMYKGFWSAIGKVVNLEGICILTESEVPVDKETVINGIKNLKYLHLFHFSAPGASNCLFSEAKMSMRKHGVKNVKVEKSLHLFSQSSRMQYYHQHPHFCCRHLHLKDFDI